MRGIVCFYPQITACTPLNFPLIMELLLYACALIFSFSKFQAIILSRNRFAKDTPRVSSGCINSRNISFISASVVIYRTESDTCWIPETSGVSSAMKPNHLASRTSAKMLRCICCPINWMNSFWICKLMYCECLGEAFRKLSKMGSCSRRRFNIEWKLLSGMCPM